jgi:hypothetical protein
MFRLRKLACYNQKVDYSLRAPIPSRPRRKDGLTKEEQNNYKQSRFSARITRFLTCFSLSFCTILACFAVCVSLG